MEFHSWVQDGASHFEIKQVTHSWLKCPARLSNATHFLSKGLCRKLMWALHLSFNGIMTEVPII